MAIDKFIIVEQIAHTFPGAISLHCCQFSAAGYTEKLFKKYGIHYPAELVNAVTKRRAEFLAGRYCTKKSLGALDGTTADILIGKYRNPLWPPHIVGSISHTTSHAVAVTAFKSTIRAIGIDIQDEIDRETHLKIKEHIILEEEYNRIFQENQDLTALKLFTIAFSVKESFFKAAFNEVGKYFDFHSVSIVRIDQKAQLITIRINERLSKNLTLGAELQAEYRILPESKIMTLVKLD